MPAFSPRTQQLEAGAQAGPEQEIALFEQGFSDMAYALLSSRMPDIVADVVTFKVLDVDIDTGHGVGAFVVLRNGQPLYVPVVMADNAIKPLEILYAKKLNVFVPLTRGWLDEIDKTSLASLGEGIKTPETLYTDVDIRNVVVPPITGRFSYAAASATERVAHDKAVAGFPLKAALSVQHLEKSGANEALMLPRVLAQAPNSIKAAYSEFLRRNPRTLKQAAAVYGVAELQRSLAPTLEKAAAKQLHGGALWIVGQDSTPTEFRRVFGDKAGEAYAGVRLRGYAARDERKEHNLAVQEQPYASLTEPSRPGVYCLYGSDGSESYAFVAPNPVDLFDDGTRYGRRPAIPARNPLLDNSYDDAKGFGRTSNKVYPYGRPNESEYATRRRPGAPAYLAVFGDGAYIEPDKLVGRESVADDLAGQLHRRLFVDVNGAPSAGKGFFVRQRGTTFEATAPIEIKSTTVGSDGVRRIRAADAHGFGERTLATDPRSPHGSIWMPKGSDVVYVPPDFVWIPLKARGNAKAWFQSALDLAACMSSALSRAGAKKVAIKDAGARQFSVAKSLPLSRIDALRKLAFDYALSVQDAEALLDKAASEHETCAWIVSVPQLAGAQLALSKAAGDDNGGGKKPAGKKDKAAPPEDDQPAGDDAMLGQEAAMAAVAPPAPPPPAPLDLAAMEMDQAIQAEMQKLVDRQQTIQALLARSTEIAGGAPPAPSAQTQAMGAPPPSQNLATGAPMASPGMPVSPPQPGAMPQAAPQGAPGAGALASGMPQPGGPFADPMAGAGGIGTPGSDMDPSTGGAPGAPQPAHGAMMPPDGPNAQALPEEVNPQFLDQAAALHSADMFDAAAVATLAQSPALHAVVAQCLPNLEKTVDNLARVRLTLWMQESVLKPQVGEQTFAGLDESMQATFKGLGDLVLRLSRGVQAVKEPGDHAT